MSAADHSLPSDYFDRLYSADPDPWKFASSAYERDKYLDTLSALGDARFARVCEIGCSIGVFTRMLAPRCEKLIALDVAQSALAEARRRCADQPNIAFFDMRVPEEWPPGRFNLIVFSEVLYYLCPADVERCARRALASLDEDGLLLLVHWTGGTDYPMSGDDAVAAFERACGEAVRSALQHRRSRYRLDLLRKTGPRGIMAQTPQEENRVGS